MKNRRIPLSLVLLAVLPGCRLSCSAAGAQLSAGEELRAELESPYVLDTSDGTTMLGVVIHPRPAAAARAPVALALVIDNSGSMAGDKIDFARSASRAIVDALADGDEISLTQFSDAAQTLVPLVRIDAQARERLRTAIAKIAPDSGTAIYDGMRAGLASLAAAHAVSRRLILLSDGQANVGPSTPEAIVAGLKAPAPPVTLSTIGVGTDYDENVLAAISKHGSGGFHHLNDPVQLTQILQDELEEAHAVIGTDATVEITAWPGVQLLAANDLAMERLADGSVRIAVGDLYANKRRTVMVPIKVPVTGSTSGAVGSVRLRYRSTDHREERHSQVDVRYTVTASSVEVARGAVPELMVAADRTRVGHALGDAAALLKEGDLIEAQTILRDERARLLKRIGKLSGPDRAEAEQLVTMLRDPYVDASPVAAPPASPTKDTSEVSPARFLALMDAAQKGQPLPEGELASLDGAQLRLLRNVPYARHGYTFNSDELRRQFAAMSWYHADPRFDNARLTRADADNIALVHSYEGRAQLLGARPAKRQDPATASAQLEKLLQRTQKGEPLASVDVETLDLGQLRFLRNTTYARHGYVFRSSDLQAFFAAKPWYRANPSYQEKQLTPTDAGTIALIQARERGLLASVGGDVLRDFELRSRARAWQAVHP